MSKSEGAPGSQAHGRMVADMFGRIARWYDFLNHLLSLGVDTLWRRSMAACLDGADVSGAPILDVAAGTMDVSIALARRFPTCRVLAMDFCPPMLKAGLPKLKDGLETRILPAAADARALPLADRSVSAVTIAFGIRNVKPRAEAYAEMLRVLRPGGRLVILEFGSGRQRILRGIYNFYLNRLLPLVGRLFSSDRTAYSYLAETITAFPTAQELADELRQAGFESVSARPLSFGIVYLHQGVKPA